MPDFLQTILTHRRHDVAEAMASTPLDALRPAAEAARAGRRPFAARLQAASPVGIIAEIKRASPSKGDLAPALDPAALARAYEAGGAAALSVLTEPRFFKGSPADLAAARAACALPVLRKDFLFCDYQLYESAALHADAVLLIVRLLDEPTLTRLHRLALELGLDPLVEVCSAAETDRAVRLGAALIGINARDLATFEMDPGRAARIAPPPAPGRIVIAASGIAGPADVRRLRAGGISHFLVGESLVRDTDPAAALRRLIGAECPPS